MTTIIERRVQLDYSYLDKYLITHLFETVKKKIENECTKEDGYILNVKKFVKIKNHYISNIDSMPIFIIQIEVETLKPEKDKEYMGVVCMNFTGGILLDIKNKIKVVIPTSCLQDFIFNAQEKKYIHNFKNYVINENDEIKICIVNVRYAKQKFSCIGELNKEQIIDNVENIKRPEVVIEHKKISLNLKKSRKKTKEVGKIIPHAM